MKYGRRALYRAVLKLTTKLFLIWIAALSAAAATGLDPSFGTEGKVVMNGGGGSATAYSTVFAVAIDPAGRIYLTGPGRLQNVNVTGISVARQNADGSPDTTFGTNGRRIVSFPDGNGGFYNGSSSGMVILPDGSVIAVGRVANLPGGASSAAVIKFLSTGFLDTTFGDGGSGTIVTTAGASTASFNSVMLLTDGSFIVAGGNSAGNFLIAKYSSAGVLDGTFGTAGIVTTDFNAGNDSAASIVHQPDGKFVVAGRSTNDCAVARYNANGSLDTGFGTGGKVVTAVVPGNPDYLNKVLLQPDGKIVGLGIAAATGFERHLLVRYNANGSLDSSFGSGGIAGGYFGNSQEFLRGGVLLPNGKIFVTGYSSGTVGSRASVARYNADGTVDKTFLCNGSGLTFFDPSSFTYYYSATLQADGKVIAAGQGRSLDQTVDSFAFARFSNSNTGTQCAAGDFERDGRSDLAVFRPSNGTWYLNPSSDPASFKGVAFGLSTDKLASADYDGDGRTDVAVWRENASGPQAYFYILNSTNNTVRYEPFGNTGDLISAGDWDGDGMADPAVFRDGAQSYFHFRGSLNNMAGNITSIPWGMSGDRPVQADFDGDGKIDPAVYRAAGQTWYIRRSSDAQLAYSVFGLASDTMVPADYDGDGKADVAVYRPSDGNWYLLQSSNAQFRAEHFGLNTDIPVPRDFDGDGKADIGVFRAGLWIVLQSSSSQILYQQFGAADDRPVL